MATKLDKITVEDNKTVKVRLHARMSSLFKSLDQTALRHFNKWQHRNFSRLGYKSCEIVTSERESIPDDDVHYFYTLVIRLVY